MNAGLMQRINPLILLKKREKGNQEANENGVNDAKERRMGPMVPWDHCVY